MKIELLKNILLKYILITYVIEKQKIYRLLCYIIQYMDVDFIILV